MRKLIVLIILLCGVNGYCNDTTYISCLESDQYLLTHQLVPVGPIPTAFDADGVYPYVSFSETANRPEPVKYRFIDLENRLIKITICPDLGGKVTSIIEKSSNKKVLYNPGVIRPTRILPRFNFVAGGIEVSFPISHSPTQNNKLLYKIDKTADRIYVTCGERELHFGMQWSIEYSLGDKDNFLTQRVIFHNPGKKSYPWMSWSNAALPSASDTRFYFPEGNVLSHSSVIDTIDWKRNGVTYESELEEMTGFFWLTHNINAFGAFTPSFGSGLFHIAKKTNAPGIKLWSYGIGADSSWATLSTAKRKPYIEIQGGPTIDQSIKTELQPGKSHSHTEFWIPTDTPLNINSLIVPVVKLRSVNDIPLFGWARQKEVKIWNDLIIAFNEGSQPPNPPAIEKYNWAPSGMEDLEPAFNWAISNSDTTYREDWKFYFGTWLAGSGDTITASKILSKCEKSMAKILLARILSLQGKYEESAEELRKINENWLQIHPQIVVERDKILRKLGKKTINERGYWLNQVNAFNDEWIIERRVQLMIDKGDFVHAKKLLLATKFQKIHQSYSRTGLWFQICDSLNEPRFPIPSQLGEDRLARFGAYREYEGLKE